MVIRHEIECNKCKQPTGKYWEDFSHIVMTGDVLCPNCGETILKAPPKPIYNVLLYKHRLDS